MIYTLFIPLTIFISIVWFILWSTHLAQTKDFSKTWGRGTYKTFKREWHSHNMKPKYNYYGSWYGDNDSEYHASIIRFDENGMTLGPIDWLRACYFVRKVTKGTPGTLHKW